MIHSMTGYASREYSSENLTLSIEIKGYNNRYLDPQISLPSTLGRLEQELRDELKTHISRGRVEVYLRLQSGAEQTRVRIDDSQAEALVDAMNQLKRRYRLKNRPSLSDLMAFDGIIKLEKQRDQEDVLPIIRSTFSQALTEFNESRQREGESTARDIMEQLQRFGNSFQVIRNEESRIESHINTQLRSRFQEVLGDRIEEDRILTELASLLVKHSINEEISRLQAHIQQFTDEFNRGGAVGKRLDFLCQEMNRETNTIGSKNLLKEISAAVIDMKDALENIREQLRNIE
ncbi:YicC/YloC family endoribonuclease [Salinispira pacifica]|uniref:Protein YicC n=1 Tax=Salinispira pacifica TaxID=1307761 RepID=V5WK08_9SPIO|nr:YicC/YloC family endoribonuclease [Salinispira pacifica]AHC16073.1 Protein YicC [Salinispira pacifica]